ncbi:hypothetical protein Pan44_39470 [Caulifigura coniformis]|uniref:Sialidase domain-containing protein n=1 Tax=Caulifigura coniformis TaxID=2527983 RepID=A0A517SIF2_9PLAN|nr:hypothetical protein Pan44_39470 [Caulifigura coniformis]
MCTITLAVGGNFDQDCLAQSQSSLTASRDSLPLPAPQRLLDWTGSPGGCFSVAADRLRNELHLIVGDRSTLFHSRSADGGDTWSPLKELVRGESPDAAVDQRGNLHVVYKSPDHDGRIEHRSLGDGQLSEATDISASEGDRPATFLAPRIALDGGDNVHVVYWSILRGGDKRDGFRMGYAHRKDGNPAFDPVELWRDQRQVGFSKYGDLFVDEQGNIHIFQVTNSNMSHGIERRIRKPTGEWIAHDRWESKLMADWSLSTAVGRDGVVHVAMQRIVDQKPRVLYLNNRDERDELAMVFDGGPDTTETYTDLLLEDDGAVWLATGHREGPGRGSSSPLNVAKLYRADAETGVWSTGAALSPAGAVNLTSRAAGHPRLARCGGKTRVVYLESDDGQRWTLWQRVLK